MEVGRPAQKSQPSRKGKKAWRKNIDIDDVEKGMEEARTLAKEIGTADLTSVPQDQLFTVDTTGDSSKSKKNDVKPLKADEILARRSNVAPLVAPHKKKDAPKSKGKTVEGVSSKEIHKLMKVAGRAEGGDIVGQKADEGDFDLWDDEPQQPAKKKDPKDYAFLANTAPGGSHLKPKKAPKTLSEAPISFLGDELSKAVAIPEAGKSYNPDHEEWVALLKREHAREEEREKKRLQLLEQKKRIEELMAQQDKEVVDDSDDDDDDNEDSDDDDDQQNENVSSSLSVNKPVKVKKKVKSQRTKEQKRKEMDQMRQQVKTLKQQVRDLENLPRLIKQELALLEAKEQESNGKAGPRKRTRKLGSKHALAEPALEIKLSDELTDTLRRLKPEGSLVHDRFRGLQERGLIEVRLPVAKRRKYTPKVTEKWSFKDFK